MITEPGIHDLTDIEYHADPVEGGSLSSSGARVLLDCPAKFEYERVNGRLPKRTFEFGHAAHHAVLGVGAEMAVLDHPNYKKNAAQSDRDAARAAGKIPLLVHEAEVVIEMATALRAHPVASMLFQPGTGRAEQSLFARDKSGLMLRSRFDWLRDTVPGQRLLIPDYKTCVTAHPDAVQRSIADYGYHVQAAFYKRVAKLLGLAPNDAAFLLVCQEKTPPYLVSVVEPASSSLAWGDQLIDHAIEVYQQCTESGHWPGYTEPGLDEHEPFLRELPRYVEQQYEIARERGLFDLGVNR